MSKIIFTVTISWINIVTAIWKHFGYGNHIKFKLVQSLPMHRNFHHITLSVVCDVIIDSDSN